MNEAQREQVAMFRFGVIGALVSGELAHGELKQKLLELSSRRYSIPFSPRTSIGFGTLEEWLSAYRHRGFEGLKPAVRSDHGRIKVIRPQLKQELIALKREQPKLSAKSITQNLLRQNIMKPGEISHTTIYRLFSQEGLKRKASKTGKEQKRFVYRYPNDCWQGDVMHGPYIKDWQSPHSRKTYLIAFIDDASRLIAGAAFFFAETAANTKTVLRRAVQTYGVPSRLYLDNGKNFCADGIRLACARMRTALIHTTPYYPEGKGKIERFFRTVRSRFIPWLRNITSLTEMNNCLDQWIQNEYNRAPHSALDNAHPLDVFLKNIEGRLRRFPHHVDPAELFCKKESRLVAKDGTFRINNILYEAEEQLIGRKIDVVFDTDHPTHLVKVFHHGGYIHSATPIDYLANSKAKRKKRPS